MELKIIECSQYILNDRLKEFAQDHKIISVNYLIKQNDNILAIVDYTITKEYKKQLAKEEKEEKLEEQRKEVKHYL